MKKLPIGIQTFEKIRSDDYIYIDKTDIAFDIITNYTYVFLSRPRRFGKSLFLDTLRNIFEGKKELFKGLAIYDKWNWEETYPVIKISFSGVLSTVEDIKAMVFDNLKENEERLKVNCEEKDSVSAYFSQLIRNTHFKYNQKVVILIDEYDKAILDNIDMVERAHEAREFLRGFYSVIKGSDEYIRFAFLTGVTRFSKASIFSGLNMLTDITLDERYGNVCGYTQKDLEESFKEYLNKINGDLEKIKEWYNGYYFLKDKLYNPFDILQFFDKNGLFDNYWFETGTPTFLIKLIKERNYFLPALSNLKVDKKLLSSFDIENLDLEVILFQSGYLTIDSVEYTPFDTIEYRLKIPNREVKQSFTDFIIDKLLEDKAKTPKKVSLYKSLGDANMKEFEQTLISLFASIPYNNFVKNNISEYEGFYASVLYAYLQSLGFDIEGEDVTNQGRIDLAVKLPDVIYLFEFKVIDEEPLRQMKEKGYYQKYLSSGRDIYLVGIVFDREKRNIKNFIWEKM
jgi:hypothetical protein